MILAGYAGSPKGFRTPVSAVRERRRPWTLLDKFEYLSLIVVFRCVLFHSAVFRFITGGYKKGYIPKVHRV